MDSEQLNQLAKRWKCTKAEALVKAVDFALTLRPFHALAEDFGKEAASWGKAAGIVEGSKTAAVTAYQQSCVNTQGTYGVVLAKVKSVIKSIEKGGV